MVGCNLTGWTRNRAQSRRNQRSKRLLERARFARKLLGLGGPTRIWTWNQQIMSPKSVVDTKENQQLTSAESGKTKQNPQPRRNLIPFPKKGS